MSDCIFCKIVEGAIPAQKIYEDDEFLAFYDLAPQSTRHFLVIPKKHIANIMECTEEDSGLLGRLLWRAQKIAVELGLGDRGARFVINCKEDGSQTVPHLHLHVLGGRVMGWPPG
ncbi:MAG: histidine triad nucleotide-binding protein [Spirochaetaceae bacterium]|jgi:histidine triad (HIT) family protein|nr:histidine triad nucleotide-binding protein [Spirochaetaceae bacterium]